MSDLQQQSRQAKAQKRKKRNAAALRRARKAKQAHRVPSPDRVRARTKTERFEVDLNCTWVVVRAEFNRAIQCAKALREAGYPVFEARQEERVVAETGKARVAQIPVLRRLMFVGLDDGRLIGHQSEQPRRQPHLSTIRYLEAVWSYGDGALTWTPREWLRSACPVAIGPLAMQKFADNITGHMRGDEEVKDLVDALFRAGDAVRITEGPFLGQPGNVQEVNQRTSRYKIDVTMLGGTVRVELHENQLEAA